MDQLISVIAAYPDAALAVWMALTTVAYCVVPVWMKPFVNVVGEVGKDGVRRLSEKQDKPNA
jgi:hypothetical protein